MKQIYGIYILFYLNVLFDYFFLEAEASLTIVVFLLLTCKTAIPAQT